MHLTVACWLTIFIFLSNAEANCKSGVESLLLSSLSFNLVFNLDSKSLEISIFNVAKRFFVEKKDKRNYFKIILQYFIHKKIRTAKQSF
jgi:hypothetical protein